MDWLQIEHGVAYLTSLPSFWSDFRAFIYNQGNWNEPAQIIVGKAQPLEDWCWAFSVVHAQMGACSYIEL